MYFKVYLIFIIDKIIRILLFYPTLFLIFAAILYFNKIFNFKKWIIVVLICLFFVLIATLLPNSAELNALFGYIIQ